MSQKRDIEIRLHLIHFKVIVVEKLGTAIHMYVIARPPVVISMCVVERILVVLSTKCSGSYSITYKFVHVFFRLMKRFE